MYTFSKILSLGAFVSSAWGQDLIRCGTGPPSEAFKSVHATFAQDAIGRVAGISAVSYNVDTYVHIIEDAANPVSDTQITDQIKALNTAYSNSGFTFTLAGAITRTTNDNWKIIGGGTAAELEMKTALHQGTYKDLNLYFAQPVDTATGSTLLGFAYYPVESPSDNEKILDGAVCLWSSLPGGKEPYNLGFTAVHEVGHWLGLLHTFNEPSGCDEPGDFIIDTPAEFNASFACETGRNTCPSEGEDPIHNFMDYSVDSCMDQFTAGQFARTQDMYGSRRAGK